jgi:hypothetical protein
VSAVKSSTRSRPTENLSKSKGASAALALDARGVLDQAFDGSGIHSSTALGSDGFCFQVSRTVWPRQDWWPNAIFGHYVVQ